MPKIPAVKLVCIEEAAEALPAALLASNVPDSDDNVVAGVPVGLYSEALQLTSLWIDETSSLKELAASAELLAKAESVVVVVIVLLVVGV